MSNPKFGDRVAITKKYVRIKTLRRWEPTDRHLECCRVWELRKFISTGIFLGTRTLKDGITHHENEIGYTFESKQVFSAAIVCPGPHQNNVYVPLDAIEIIGKEG